MEFILDEAEDDAPMLQFSDEDEEEISDDLSNFIDDTCIPEECISFYQERDLQNLDDYPKFHSQTRDPIEVIFSDTESYFGEDDQPELFAPENRETVDFDKFKDFEKIAEIFKKSLLNFEQVVNYLFYSVIYGLMFYKQENSTLQPNLDKKDAQKIVGDAYILI